MSGQPDERSGLQRQVDDLTSQMDRNHKDIEDLQAGAAVAADRADEMDARALIDRELIAELQADGIPTTPRGERWWGRPLERPQAPTSRLCRVRGARGDQN